MTRPKVNIPKPCHLKWDDLTPLENTNDRHCNLCSLNIIDFTKMSDKEIINYLAERKGQKVCCAMLSDNGDAKANPFQKTVKGWHTTIKTKTRDNSFKRLMLFMLGILLTATGCFDDDDNTIIGEPLRPDEVENISEKTSKVSDSTIVEMDKK